MSPPKHPGCDIDTVRQEVADHQAALAALGAEVTAMRADLKRIGEDLRTERKQTLALFALALLLVSGGGEAARGLVALGLTLAGGPVGPLGPLGP